MGRVALVCCSRTAGGARDDAPLAAALVARGRAVEHVAWDDQHADWASYDVAAIRSTWDYHLRADEFAAWTERAGRATRLVNAPAIVRWNIDKRYLLDLERAGVPITPSVLVEEADGVDLAAIVAERAWDRFVVKPTVGATAYGAARFDATQLDAAAAHLERLLERGGAIVQRYEPAIERAGERSIMVIGAEPTHCVVKRPVAGDFRCQSDFGGTVEAAPLTDGDVDLALRAVATAPASPAFARVDVIDTPDGVRVMELELIEPEMFFRLSERAVARTADALAKAPERKPGANRAMLE